MLTNPFGLIFAGLLLVFGLAVWFVFLRPVPRETAVGVVTQKTFKPAGQYWQFPTGERSSFFGPTRIPIAECYVFVIQAEGQPLPAAFSLNTVAAEQFAVGQKVAIVYEVRGLPLIWKVACVLEMKPA